MSLLFLDSFDHYDTAQMNRKWNYIPTFFPPTIVSSGRNGNGASVLFAPSITLLAKFDTMTVGIANKTPSLNGPSITISSGVLEVGNAFSAQYCGMCPTGDGRFYARTSVGNSGPSARSVKVNEWYYLEMKAAMTVDGVFPAAQTVQIDFEFRINEESILVGSLSDEIACRETGWAYAKICGPSSVASTFDDMYITDGEFLGDIVVGVIRPNGVGPITQWDPSDPLKANWELVNEHSPDDDTTYVSTVAEDATDLYEMEDIGIPEGSVIKGIQGLVCNLKTDAGTGILQPRYRIGAGDWNGGDYYDSAVSYVYARDAFRTNPLTGDDFTVAEINALLFGKRKYVPEP